MKYVTQKGDMLDEICWHHYGRTSGVVEAVLKANHGLADKGMVYDGGLEITLPEFTADAIDVEEVLWT